MDSTTWEEARHALPPHWVDAVDDIKESIESTKKLIDRLHTAHKNRLLVRFDDQEGVYDKTIDTLTRKITQQFREAERKLKRIALSRVDVSQSEANVRLNIQRSLAVQLQEMSMRFRKSQKEYLGRLKSQKSGGTLEGFLGADETSAKSSISLGGVSDEQSMMFELAESTADERDQEIQKIAKSIEELAHIFKELAVLVIDQGTVLDRIDYNMEQVVETTKKGMGELRKAEKYSKSSRPMKCIIILCILILVLVFILAKKWSK